MASSAPIGRERAIQLVADNALPVALGSPKPKAMVVEQDGSFRIRELVINYDEIASSRSRARSPSWMPEHYFSMGRPTGKIFAEAASLDELLAVMRTMPWPSDW
ncbi:MAG: hypothetical protein AB7P03_20800 [Kofleriaceae bacterium]